MHLSLALAVPFAHLGQIKGISELSHNYRNKQDNFIIVFYYYHGMLLVIMDAIIMFWLNKQW